MNTGCAGVSVMAGEVTLRERYTIAAQNFNAAGDASADIKGVLRRLGIGTAVIRRIATASYEAELNIAIHSLGGTLSLTVSRESITLSAEDCGPGIADIAQAMTEGFSTAPESVRQLGFGAGMGLPNMQRCADEFTITSELGRGTSIRMVFHLE